MPGLNTTGAPNTRDYTLGRGITRFAALTAAGLPDADGFRDLGNATEFNITTTVEELTHQSSRSGLKITDSRCTISQEIGIGFILDELNFQNVSDYFAGSTEVFNNLHDTTWAATASIVAAVVKVGNWYQLFSDTGIRVYDLGATGLVYTIVQDPAGVPQTLAGGGDDYEVDEEMGLVRLIAGGTNAVVDGDVIGFAITTGATTPQDLDQVNALKREDVTGALLFIQENACDEGNKTEYQFHKVSLSAEGDLPLISDEHSTLGFSGIAGVNSGVTDTSQVLTVRTYDQKA